jgi:hypothetical protein
MLMPPPLAWAHRHHAALLLAALGVYTLAIRVYGIHQHFWMYGDQMRDWLIAIGPMRELPLVGTPSTAGGTSLGPSFYWTLWIIATVLGPWFDHLPHAGGIGLSLLQSIADVLVAFAIWRRVGSLATALAVVLLAASSPHDLAISATIWNPVLAVVFAKVALALLLLYGRDRSPWKTAAVAATAWLAVQAHSGALFVAAACFLWYVLRELAARRYRDAAATAFGLQLIVLALQVPFLLNLLRRPASEAAPTAILDAVGQAGQQGVVDLTRSVQAVGGALDVLVTNPWSVPWFPWLLLGCAALVVFRHHHEPDLIIVTAAPIALAMLGFASWTRPFDSYWFLPLVPSAALLLVLAVAALPWRRAAGVVPVVLLAAILAAQPARVARSHEFLRLPEYDALVRGSRQIAKYGQPVARIEADFVDPEIDREVLFTLLGGETREDGPIATILPDGSVRFERNRP